MTEGTSLDVAEPDALAVSPRCIVVIDGDGVAIKQSGYAPRWQIELPELELLAALDASPGADLGVIKVGIADAAGIDESRLNDFILRLHISGSVRNGPVPRHRVAGERAVRPTPATSLEPEQAFVLHTPLSLRIHRGVFELIDHDGCLVEELTPAEVAALAELARPSTVAQAHERHVADAGARAVDADRFRRLAANVFDGRLLVPATTVAAPVDEDPDSLGHADIVRAVFDRHAAEQSAREAEREQATGVHRTRVIPVAFDISTPAGLGMVVAFAKAFEGGRLEETYQFRTDWVWSDDRFEEFTAEPAIYLFSNYLWSHARCLEVSERIKAASPASITIHGGPDTPKYEKDMYEYFDRYPHVDVTVRGEGEMTAAHVLDALRAVIGDPEPDLSVLRDVEGIGYRDGSGVHRTPNRDRIAELDILPSPYLTGLFDVYADVPDVSATFESNRGCPYGCTFCDWGSATTSRIRKFDIERVFAEIDWCANNGVSAISLADANFGIFARDVDIAQRVADRHREFGEPRGFGVSYAKNTVKHVRPIISILAEAGIMSQGVLSLQTMDPDTLDVVHRSNIKTAQYDQLANEMRLSKLPLMVELMMGLPGQTVDAFADDLQQCIDRGVPARVNITTLLVNSPMNEPSYLEEHRIETSEPLRPGVNAVVVATSSFTRDDFHAMQQLRSDFMLYENWSVLRHVAPFVRRETAMREIDFYRLIRTRCEEQPERWPALQALVAFGAALMAPPHSWSLVLDDLRQFLIEDLGLADDAALASVLKAQLAVLPAYGRSFPTVIELDHDVAEWSERIMATKASGHLHDWESVVPRLREMGPGVIRVDDPADIVGTSIGISCDMNVIGFNWEFDSPLSRASVAASQFADWSADSLLAEGRSSDRSDQAVRVELAPSNRT